jgi:serine protease AprX
VNGPDLSFESQNPALRYRDTYGHGTHLAAVMTGSDAPGSGGVRGLAPGASLTSVKVGVTNGAVDVSQVIAAVDWVVEHRDDDPARPIRVLNLSYGTDGTQDYRTDPLAHAVENAWRAGIVVVTAAGNTGTETPKLANPAYDPYVLAVGAVDTRGTGDTKDDTVMDFSSRGDASRRVDLVAPGRSVVSLRAPGSYIDTNFAGARVGDRLFKGSGTSQAAAVTSAGIALLLQQRPSLTPDQVKKLVADTAAKVSKDDPDGSGAGELDLRAAARKPAKNTRQAWAPSTGLGSLEPTRGTVHVEDDGVELTGERDIFGPFDTALWAPASTDQTAWTGGDWMGNGWTGDGWTGSSWAGRTWSGRTWSGRTWSGRTWSGRTWSDRAWAANAWS